MTEFRAAKGLFEESSDRCKLKEGDQTSYENVISYVHLDFKASCKISCIRLRIPFTVISFIYCFCYLVIYFLNLA